MTEAIKANALLVEAKNKMESFSWPWSANNKFEEAGEIYKKAANLFKLAKEWNQAGDSFLKAVDCYSRIGLKHEVAENFVRASNCYKKAPNVQEAIKCLQRGIEFYIDEGRFSIAGRHQKEIAEMFESESDFNGAMEAYQKASDYYEGESQTSHANTCLLKVALIAAQLEEYKKAIEIYERVAKTASENNLLQWSVKDYLFRSGLCHLCLSDTVATERAFEYYQGYHTFANNRECKLLLDLLEAKKEGDVQRFTDLVAEFDSISPLDPWKTTLLLRIKNAMKENDEESIC